jgi:hypothetical protein
MFEYIIFYVYILVLLLLRDHIKRSPPLAKGVAITAERVVRRRLATTLFTFEYFASLDNHHAQKDSSADILREK